MRVSGVCGQRVYCARLLVEIFNTVMRKRLPPLNPLRAFEAAARHLSVARAARELNVTGSAVSHQIRTLEESLKVVLFDREGKRLRLSPQGAILLRTVGTAFDAIAETSALLTTENAEGDLVVSCGPALAYYWLIPRLGEFSKRYPGIRLELITSKGDVSVSSPDIDFWIRYGNGSWPQRHVQLWTQLVLFPVCSPKLVNAKPLRDVTDLASHSLLHSDDGREWQNWLSAANAPSAISYGYHHKMTDAHLAIEAAIHGYGIALGDNITTSRLLAEGQLVMPLALKVPAPASYYILCRKELRNSAIVQAFANWLTTEIATIKRLPRKKQIQA
jgi:LysR family glycine cleavage system transcriptional activator